MTEEFKAQQSILNSVEVTPGNWESCSLEGKIDDVLTRIREDFAEHQFVVSIFADPTADSKPRPLLAVICGTDLQDMANAALMAAAPEMRRALEQILKDMDGELPIRTMRMAQKALDKCKLGSTITEQSVS